MNWKLWLALVVCVAFAATAMAAPPTPADVKAAAARGVAWLVGVQDPSGCWACSSIESEAITAFALLKLEHHAVDPKYGLGLPSPFDPRNPYKANIERGLNWLLARAEQVSIVAQLAGNPDTNGNTFGARFGWEHHTNYATALTLSAVCQAGDSTRLIAGGPYNGKSYALLAEDMMNYFAFGQEENPPYRGGWAYYGNYGWADNSNAGYVSLGLAYYEAKPPTGCGLPVPQFVKNEMNFWLDYIQNDVNGDAEDGGSGYSDPGSWVNILKTGNLIQQFAFVGDPPTSARVKAAVDYLIRHWGEPNNEPGWNGPGVATYQATFTTMKGLTAYQFPLIGTIDWQADFDTILLAQQMPAGNWPYSYWDSSPNAELSTIWALLTLQRAAPILRIPVPVDIRPGSCPNPFNVRLNGNIPVALAGTKDLPVAKIDPASVKLEGISPIRWSFSDSATPFTPFLDKPLNSNACTTATSDGLTDIVFHFDAPAVAAALKLPIADREVRVLKLTGNLKPEFGGTPIAGEDVVILLVK